MRYGCCGSMIDPLNDPIGIEKIDIIKDMGYDYIELSLAHITALNDKEFYNLKRKVVNSGIKCEVCNNFIVPSLKVTGPLVDGNKNKLYVEKALRLACELGADTVVFGSGKARNIPEGFPTDIAWKQLVHFLKNTGEIARNYGITLAIEPLNKLESNILNNMFEVLKLFNEVDMPNVKVLADFYHFTRENDSVEHLSMVGYNLQHVHFARCEGRAYPKNINEDNYLPFINAIRKAGYNGRVSMEAYTTDFINDAQKALKFLKENFDSSETTY